jgi:glycosyltransferase involved in cell wall biosynthesis
MRIVIDLQGAQSTGSRNRGIGRYSTWLTQAIVRNRGDHEILLAVSGLFPDTVEEIRATFDGLLPQENIRLWHSPGPTAQIDPANTWRRKTAELVREAFLASLQPDMVLVTSLFEGLMDDAVTSIGSFDTTVPTAAVLYDLIPLIHRRPYLDNPVVEAWYHGKLDQARRARLLLAISDSSRDEGLQHLGFTADDCVSISTATDPSFTPTRVSAQTEKQLRELHGLKRPFVMYTGGIDHRKNIEGLIRAFGLLPPPLRSGHQLAIVCSIQPPDRERLARLALESGLAAGDLVCTGFVPEEDLLALYNLCKLFVFPSWHEGFGLPALEAMACGRAVIAANTSSLPEVIGREDALFDPHDDRAIAQKMEAVLGDDTLRAELAAHGLERSRQFSWDITARRALRAMEAAHAVRPAPQPPATGSRRPRLAFVSPLPPERTGIADYSAELLPELARLYEIDVVTAQESVADPWVLGNTAVRTPDWFKAHAGRYERVLYHFGNSSFHQHMFELLEAVPGVVVLHDFYLGHLAAHQDLTGIHPGSWARALYESHGYHAVGQRYANKDAWEVASAFPCNLGVLRGAVGTIVHSEASRGLMADWYGKGTADTWAVIPLLRVPAHDIDRAAARRTLGLGRDAFVVCSFGLLGPNKLNRELLEAWALSALAKDPRCTLLFVGQNDAGDYGRKLLQRIAALGMADRVRITGWADARTFRLYLAAADVGVQLRTSSRGETSAAVLDCMNRGLATIVNAHGSMEAHPDDGVWKLPDRFEPRELAAALETLRDDETRRRALGARARQCIRADHAPRRCAALYADAIESMYTKSATPWPALAAPLARIEPPPADPQAWVALAESLDRSLVPALPRRRLLVDVSTLVQHDARSGIQRVVRSILREWLLNPPAALRVEPVYAAVAEGGYRYARKFTLRFMECPEEGLVDEPVDAAAGDLFVGLDLHPETVPMMAGYYQELRRRGVRVQFVVYDLLTLSMPQAFPPAAHRAHQQWLEVVAQSDGAVCISRAVAQELQEWLRVHGPVRPRPFEIGWFHLGADVAASAPSRGLPDNHDEVLARLKRAPTFLMVGTVEPRKGHEQVLEAFEALWKERLAAHLVVVGKQGWLVDALAERLRTHAQTGRQLHWIEHASDEYLEQLYGAAGCLIAASTGEGFGLPLIEAAQHGLPILARDLPVFREVAGAHAAYFSGSSGADLAEAIRAWLQRSQAGQVPASRGLPWQTWRQSARQLLAAVRGEVEGTRWRHDGVYRYWGNDPRLQSAVGEGVGRVMRSTGRAGFLLYGPFLALNAGQYLVRLEGSIAAGSSGKAVVDVVVQGASVRLAILELKPARAGAAPVLATLPIMLRSRQSDLEVRVRVDDSIELEISRL